MLRIRSRFVVAGSTQGERARLLTGNEVGSIPTLPAIYPSGIYRRVLVNDTDSKPVKESSILLRRCRSCHASQMERRPAATRHKAFDSPAWLQSW